MTKWLNQVTILRVSAIAFISIFVLSTAALIIYFVLSDDSLETYIKIIGVILAFPSGLFIGTFIAMWLLRIIFFSVHLLINRGFIKADQDVTLLIESLAFPQRAKWSREFGDIGYQ